MSKAKISGNFGVAPNELLNDSAISLKAKGLYVYMQSKPSEWSFSLDKIAYQNKDGIDSVRNAINELIQSGHLTKKRVGRAGGTVNFVYQLQEPTLENPTLENQTIGKSNVGKSNDIVIKKESNKESNKELIEKKIVDERFEKFWSLYDKNIQKDKCYNDWKFINTIDKDKILKTLPNYIASTPDVQFRKHPLTYLRNKAWLDEIFIPKSPNSFSEAKSDTRPPTSLITVPDNY